MFGMGRKMGSEKSWSWFWSGRNTFQLLMLGFPDPRTKGICGAIEIHGSVAMVHCKDIVYMLLPSTPGYTLKGIKVSIEYRQLNTHVYHDTVHKSPYRHHH
jgi:hypothetical protein